MVAAQRNGRNFHGRIGIPIHKARPNKFGVAVSNVAVDINSVEQVRALDSFKFTCFSSFCLCGIPAFVCLKEMYLIGCSSGVR